MGTRPTAAAPAPWPPCTCAQQLLAALFPRLRVLLAPEPCPLRQPLRQDVHGNALPAFSNGFWMVVGAAGAAPV